MRPFAFMDRRVRGFRIVEVGALGVLLVLILTVYLAKTGAGVKREDIDDVSRQIRAEKAQIAILKAEVATLEQPSRLEALSSKYLGLVPISARREVTAVALRDLAVETTGDHKTTLVVNDPLTARGSPDLPDNAAGAPAAPTAAATAAPATAASPVAAPPKPPKPVVVARAGAAPKPLAAQPAPATDAPDAAGDDR
jgi:cell division protein FtsL